MPLKKLPMSTSRPDGPGNTTDTRLQLSTEKIVTHQSRIESGGTATVECGGSILLTGSFAG